ncbi:MAG: HNH endonuclease signature motif containing protein [Bdellovibrionales bacterium]
MNKWLLPIEMEYMTVEVTHISKEEIKKIRNVYKREKIHETFYAYVIDLCSNEDNGNSAVGITGIPAKIKKYQIHHIKPISLGGTNAFSNLALVQPSLHTNCHWRIKKASKNLRKGESRFINIPHMPSIIWSFRKESAYAENVSQYCKTGYKPPLCAQTLPQKNRLPLLPLTKSSPKQRRTVCSF